MKTTRIAFLAIASGAFGLTSGTAQAAPNFSAMQIDLRCPGFDNDKGGPTPSDQPLWDTSRRVFQGPVLAKAPDHNSTCQQLVSQMDSGWFNVRVTWSSDKNPNLYQETTAGYIGGAGSPPTDAITLFLDANGSAKDFDKYYVDPKTNILNESGLTITLEVAGKAKCEKDKVEKHCGDHHKDRGKCEHDNGKYGSCSHKRGDGKCSHDEDDDDGNCIHEKGDGSDCVHKMGDGKCGHARANGKNDDNDGKCHHDRDDGGHCVHDKGDGRCGCDKGDKKHGGGECGAVWTTISQQRLKPVPWALWSLHSGDSTELAAQIAKVDAKITNIVNNSNKYTDDQIADLHNHIHQEIAAETVARQQGDAQTLMSANTYTDQQVKAEASARIQQDTILQKQIDGKVNSVGAAFPITSTGGTDPVIGLSTCKEGEVFQFLGGKWQCAVIGADRGNVVYNRNIPKCGNQDLLTGQTGCTFVLDPYCYSKADAATACPQNPAKCTFAQIETQQKCVKDHQVCEFWGCFPVCDEYETLLCGNCDCEFPKLGTLLK